jgi:flagellar hook-basal body complex protein FliE
MQIPGTLPVAEIASSLGVGRAPTPAGSESSFSEVLKGAVQQVDQMQADATSKIGELLSGNGQDVHSAMISVQQANLSFELMVQVRNKMVSAYQEISRLQF